MTESPVSIGTDIIEISRIRKILEDPSRRFERRVYTEVERQRAALYRDSAPFLAGRFAAKEAVLKALGTGLGSGISWQEISVATESSGAPRVDLSGRALERAESLGIHRVLLSISHSREYAVAQALGVGASDRPGGA